MILFWLLSVILFIVGVIRLVSGQVLLGFVLIILALIIPGGISIFG